HPDVDHADRAASPDPGARSRRGESAGAHRAGAPQLLHRELPAQRDPDQSPHRDRLLTDPPREERPMTTVTSRRPRRGRTGRARCTCAARLAATVQRGAASPARGDPMALYELPFPSANGRDEIQPGLQVPASPPRGVVHIVHGLGEHSRRYLHVISALVDAGFAVVAGDHAGHGATAMRSGIWADAGDEAARGVVEDELMLQARTREILPGLPYVLFGHSWGSMIARAVATAPQAELSGLILGGIAAQIRGIEQTIDRDALADAAHGGQRAEPAPEELVGQLFDGFLERFGEGAGPTAWVALDEDVVADHGRDPFNNFGAP